MLLKSPVGAPSCIQRIHKAPTKATATMPKQMKSYHSTSNPILLPIDQLENLDLAFLHILVVSIALAATLPETYLPMNSGLAEGMVVWNVRYGTF